MCCVQTKPLLPCVIDQMKWYMEKKREDVGFHSCLPDVFRNFYLSSLCSAHKTTKVGTVLPCPHQNLGEGKQFLFPFPKVSCVTHKLASAPAVAPRTCICHPFGRQKALSSELRPSVTGGNTYSFFSRARTSCWPSTSIRSFSDARWLWWDNREERGWENWFWSQAHSILIEERWLWLMIVLQH